MVVSNTVGAMNFNFNPSAQRTMSYPDANGTVGLVTAFAANAASTLSNGAMVFSNSNGVSFGFNGSTLTASVAAAGGGAAISAAGSSVSNGTVVFSNSNGHTFGMNGSTVTASTGWTVPSFDNLGYGALTNIGNIGGQADGRPMLVPFELPAYLTASRFVWEASRITTGQNSFSVTIGVFTLVNSTQISLLGSFSNAYVQTQTASISGICQFYASNLPAALTALTPGPYIMAMALRVAVGVSSGVCFSLRGAVQLIFPNTINALIFPGSNVLSTAGGASFGQQFLGVFSASTAAMPNAIGATDITMGNVGGGNVFPYWFRLDRAT